VKATTQTFDFAILPHPEAPLFTTQERGQQVIKDLIVDINSGLLSTDFTRLIEVIRQASLVSLFFFLKYVVAGQFAFLTETLHLDMCNFRQSPHCMSPGSKVAVFMGRGFGKTTIFSTGGLAWELWRNPSLRTSIFSAKEPKAKAFFATISDFFETHPLVDLLSPGHRIGRNEGTKSEFRLANAKVRYTEPTLSYYGISGAVAGGHFDILDIDDPVGEQDTVGDYDPGLSMDAVKRWLALNTSALLVSKSESRVFVVGTRYGPGDAYTGIWEDCKAFYGYTPASAKVVEGGNWVVYYRNIIEDGVATNPFIMTVEQAADMQLKHPLEYAYNYANDVTVSLTNEFGSFVPKKCVMSYSSQHEMMYVRPSGEGSDAEDWIPLAECETCISVDWAGSSRQRSTRTSRSSIGLWAVDDQNRRYRLDQFVGFFGINDVFDKIYELAKRWKGYVSTILIEADAMQLAVADVVEAQHRFRELGVTFVRSNARQEGLKGPGQKIVRIRTGIGVFLTAGLVYLADNASLEFNQERLAFGPKSTKLDVLDESSKAMVWLTAPISDDERLNRQYRVDESNVEAYAINSDAEYESTEMGAFPY
jgi:hypothetical protein